MPKTTLSNPITCTFRSRGHSRRVWKARFECGADNAMIILRYCHTYNAEIIHTER